ncbi:MAG TPA: hypothetical protein VIO94_17125 [Phenylobacterium sp.]
MDFHLTRSALLLGLALTFGPCAAAQAQTEAAASEPQAVTIDRLQSELARRDAVIVDLLNRVRALESARPAPAAQVAVATSSPFAADAAQTNPAPPSGAAEYDVDEIAAERALERTLTQVGVSLLPPGRAEVSANLAYSRSERDFPVILATPSGSLFGERTIAAGTVETELGLSVGLPADAQVEISVPYRWSDVDTTNTVGGVGQTESGADGSGFGALSVGLAKTLWRDDVSQSSLIGRVTWLTDLDDDAGAFDDPIGDVLAAQLSGSIRRDPVVFFGSLGYSHFFDEDGWSRDGGFGGRIGAAVALSPESALTFALSQAYAPHLQYLGVSVPGTENTYAAFEVGASTLIARSTLLRFGLGVGLTEDTPDYRLDLGLSVPLRVPYGP